MDLSDHHETSNAVYYTHRGAGRDGQEGPHRLGRAVLGHHEAQVWTMASGGEEWYYRVTDFEEVPVPIAYYPNANEGLQTDDSLLMECVSKRLFDKAAWQEYVDAWLQRGVPPQ